ncbi:MAG: ATP-grasp domain-containing protein [Methanolinea sp.]|nr:ATP-grasp domain-containing protein [Methanolinea sp.]
MIHIVPKPTDTPGDNSTSMVAREITRAGGSYAYLDLARVDPFSSGISGSLVWVCGLSQDEFQFEAVNALSVQNRVINSPLSIFTCASKVLTSALLIRNGIPTPTTCFTSSREIAEHFLARHGQAVIKPVYGYDGNGIVLIRSAAELGDPPYYLQEYVPNMSDYRVFVIDGEAVGAISRSSHTLAHNIHQGGIGKPIEIDDAMAECSVAAAAAVGVDYGGVDLLRRDGGYCVLEVNGTPNWHCMGVNIPRLLAGYLLEQEELMKK